MSNNPKYQVINSPRVSHAGIEFIYMPTLRKELCQYLKKRHSHNFLTYKSWEDEVRGFNEGVIGTFVDRWDYKNHRPDFFVVNHHHMIGIECKRYMTTKTCTKVIEKWIAGQPKQYESFKRIVNHVPIYLFIAFNHVDVTVIEMRARGFLYK